MASDLIPIDGLPMDESKNVVHPAIAELFFNTHHDFNNSPFNTEMSSNKGYFNLKHEAVDFIISLRQLKVRQSYDLTVEMLVKDFLTKI